MQFNLSEWALAHRSFVVYCMIAVTLAGVMAYLRLGRNEDPAFTFRTMVVQAAWPGATLGETLDQVTERIERTLQETPSLDFLRSYTSAGITTIFVNLKGSTPPRDVPDIWYHVRKSVGDIRHTLPAGVVGPGFNDEFGDTFGIIYGFTADGFTHRELRDYVENIRARLLRVKDVSKIEVLGAQDEKIIIEFSTQKLAGLGIDRAALIAALQAQNAVSPAGTLQTGDEKLALRVSGAFDSELDILAVNIASNGRLIRLGDIADVRRIYVDPPQPMLRVNGKPAIGLAIAMRDGGDILTLGRNIQRTMDEITADLPLGIDPTLVANQSSVVQSAIGEFMTSLWQAIAIIMAVSVVSLGLRPGAIVALSIPLTLAVVFPVMELVSIDLQRISLGALIIALTLLVDDAMSTIDAMTMRLAQGDEKEQAATFAYKTLAFPMLTGSLVTMAGFVPIGFAKSSAGEYTFSIFAVVSIAVLASWLVAVLFIPLLGVAFLSKPTSAQPTEPGRVVRFFRDLLVVAMRRRWITIALTLACFVVSLLAIPYVSRQFFPSSDRPELLIDLRLPQNASIYASSDLSAKLDGILSSDPDVERWSAYVGRGAIRFYLPLSVELPNDFFSQFVVIAKDIAARERLRAKLERKLQEEFPGAVTRIVPLELGPPVGWPVQYRISGPDVNEVRDIALQLAQIVASDARARRINFDWIEPGRKVRVRIDQDQARLLGLSSESVAAVLNTVMSGAAVTQVRDGIYLVDVVMRANDEQRLAVDAAQSAVSAPERPHRPARSVRDPRLRAGLPADLAPRRRPDPHASGRRDARRIAGSRGGRARTGGGETRCELAQGLPYRRRRHGRGKRAVASLGLRCCPTDAVHHDHRADDPAAELQPAVPGAERRPDGADRHRRRAPPVQQAARLRGHSRDIGAGRHDRAQRSDPHRSDRERAGAGQGNLGRGDRSGDVPLPSDHADRDLDGAWHDTDRADDILGSDGLRDHGRLAGRDGLDAHLPARALRGVVSRRGAGDGAHVIGYLAGNQLLDARPALEPVAAGVVVVARRVVRDGLETRACLDAREPIRDARPVVPEAGEPEPIDALDVGRDLGIGQGIRVGRKPSGFAELRLHLADGLLEHLDVIAEERRLDALLDQRALALAPRRIRHLHQPLLEPGADLLLELPPERDREAHRGAGHVQDIVRQFAPQPHRRALHRIGRRERRARKHVIQIGADHARFDDRVAVVHQHRHHAARIHFLELRRQLLALGEAQMVVGPRHVLFRQHDADLLRADRDIVVIEIEHRRLPQVHGHLAHGPATVRGRLGSKGRCVQSAR
jgi:multidrug efflux pump subunit AcrB